MVLFTMVRFTAGSSAARAELTSVSSLMMSIHMRIVLPCTTTRPSTSLDDTRSPWDRTMSQ